MTTCLTKDQARAPVRAADPLPLPEYTAPLLIAKEASGGVGLRLRTQNVALNSEQGICAMVADMVLNPDGSRMFTVEEVPGFIEGLSMSSATLLLTACAGKRSTAGGGDTSPSKPSTSAD